LDILYRLKVSKTLCWIPRHKCQHKLIVICFIAQITFTRKSLC
jgi:hypothetical protein